MQRRNMRPVAGDAVNQQKPGRGSVTRSGSQISRLVPLVWDDEGGGMWDVGCGEWPVERRCVVRSSLYVVKERVVVFGRLACGFVLERFFSPAKKRSRFPLARFCLHCPNSLLSPFNPSETVGLWTITCSKDTSWQRKNKGIYFRLGFASVTRTFYSLFQPSEPNGFFFPARSCWCFTKSSSSFQPSGPQARASWNPWLKAW